jgi:hypothetical protein
LPTAGANVEYTKNNSPLRGPKLMLTIKVGNPKNAQFASVVPAIDPRTKVSFGPGKVGDNHP